MSDKAIDPRVETPEKKQPPAVASTDASPAAGPHAKPELTNNDATPGAGSLPSDDPTGKADAGTG